VVLLAGGDHDLRASPCLRFGISRRLKYRHACPSSATDRRTFRLGPLHVTVSRSGVSTSVGGRRGPGSRPGPTGTAPRVSYRLPGDDRIRKG
jgi:hypothetical protein